MRILVTGGAGFIGSNLCARLLSSGHEVVCLDNLHTGRNENIAYLLQNPKFKFIMQNVQEPIPIQADQIFHLACPASPPHYQSDPIYTIKTAFLGTLQVLELSRRLRIRVLIASTSEVYGNPQIHPQLEDYWGNVNPVGIRSCYDEGKRASEAITMDYRRMYGVDARIVRIFNTYGPNMAPDDGRVVSNFIIQALRQEPLTIYGDGSQTRSFCYVSDLVEGLIRANTVPEFNGPINLGNPAEFSILELARQVLRMTGGASPISYLPLPADDPIRRKPDITRAERELGWRPLVSLEQGLLPTVEYFRRTTQTQSLSAGMRS